MFTEPTRRLTFTPPFSYDGRYGASLVAFLLGSYLLLNANVSQVGTALSGLGGLPPTVIAVLVLQLLFAALVLIAGIVIHPTTPTRRLVAAAVVVIGLVLWFIVTTARLTGDLRLPPLSIVLVAPSFAVTVIATAAWLIVRERPGVTYLLLILTIVGGLIPFALVMANVDSGTSQMVIIPIAAIIGIGIAWLARAIAAGLSRGAAISTAPVPPAA